MSYTVGDDASVPLIVRDANGGTIDYAPTVRATQAPGGPVTTITAAWAAAAAPDPAVEGGTMRTIGVPLSSLSAGLWSLKLAIPSQPDLFLGNVHTVVGDGDTTPSSPGGPGGGVSLDLGAVGSALTIDTAGSYELDITTDVAITVSTTGDVSLRVHGTGDVTVAGQTFTVDGTAVILVVTWPRGRDAYLAGEGSSSGGDPSDTTPPTAGTLTATGGENQVSLSVAGAADQTALHASPYSFSTNGGTTWGAWQSSTSTVITELAAGSYTCRHRVRDAAGNITVGATKSATVTEPALSYAAVAQGMNPLISLDLDDAPGTTSPTQDGSSPVVASMTGTVSFGTRAGIGGYVKCADFTGTEKITLPSSVLGGAAACSVTVLCDYDDHPASTLWIFGKDSDKIRVIASSAKPNFQVEYDTAAAALQYEAELAEPFLIGMSYDGATIRGYLNGVEVASTPHTGPVPSNSNTLDLGGSFNGGINGLKIWNRALTADEHAQLADAAALS